MEITLKLDSFTRELSELGVSYVGHGVVDPDGDHTGYFSHQKWKEIYLESKFFHQEPILDTFLKNPFEAVHWHFIEENQVSCMRKEIANIVSGVTLCNFHQSYFGFLNIGFSDDRSTPDFIETYKPLIAAYHQHYDRIHMAWRSISS